MIVSAPCNEALCQLLLLLCQSWHTQVETAALLLLRGIQLQVNNSSLDSCCLVCWQVIYTESLISPSEDEDPLWLCVPVTGCNAAVFIPTQPARVAIVHKSPNSKLLSVFDISIKKTKYKSEIQSEWQDICRLPSWVFNMWCWMSFLVFCQGSFS